MSRHLLKKSELASMADINVYTSPCSCWKVDIQRNRETGTWYVLYKRNRYLRYANDPKSWAWENWVPCGDFLNLELALGRKGELEKELSEYEKSNRVSYSDIRCS